MGESYLAKSVKYQIEIHKNFAFGDFGNIVHSLTGIISDPCILVGETSEHWWDDFVQMSSYLVLAWSVVENLTGKYNDAQSPGQ